MNDLQSIYSDTLKAAQAFGKTQADMVCGEGDANASIMLVGEAPGAEETRLSRPFVGKAGKNLDEFLSVLCQERSRIFITNVVKFRPFKVSDKGRLSNRPPKSDEIKCMLPHLLKEIAVVKPDIVVTLGNVPLKAILQQSDITIGACHAKPTQASAHSHSFTLFPLYHPASIIYNRALAKVYHDDLQILKEYINSTM